jgi:hypothetical protein
MVLDKMESAGMAPWVLDYDRTDLLTDHNGATRCSRKADTIVACRTG